MAELIVVDMPPNQCHSGDKMLRHKAAGITSEGVNTMTQDTQTTDTQAAALAAVGVSTPAARPIRPKRTTRMWTKAQTQQTIKALRAAGYTVEKDQSGIYRLIFDGIELFTAMIGTRGYLISYAPKLFDENAPLEV